MRMAGESSNRRSASIERGVGNFKFYTLPEARPTNKKGGPRTALDDNVLELEAYSAASTSSSFWEGPESWPRASTSRSTNSITAMGALSP
jgi:hypothetical protein